VSRASCRGFRPLATAGVASGGRRILAPGLALPGGMQVGRTGLHVGVDGRRPCLPVPTVYSLVLFVAFLRGKQV